MLDFAASPLCRPNALDPSIGGWDLAGGISRRVQGVYINLNQLQTIVRVTEGNIMIEGNIDDAMHMETPTQ